MSGSTKLKKAAATAAVAVPAATSALFLTAEAASAAPAAGSYVVQPGDTLSQIAASHGTNWSALAEANHLANPNLIFPGQVLVLDPSTSASSTSYHSTSYSAPVEHTYTAPVQTPAPVHTYTPPVQTYTPPVHTYTPPVQHTYTAPSVRTESSAPTSHTSSVSSSSVAPSSSFQSCVIQRESGGNSQVVNSSGHYGLYQFSSSTWAAYGGSSSTFGHATAAQQTAVFNNAIARGGASNWTTYDGC